VRSWTRNVRFLAWLVAIAIATPAPATAWSAADESASPSPAARGELGRHTHRSLTPVSPRAAWHGGAPSLADPSDEPGEGSDGWLSSLDQAPPASAVVSSLVADAAALALPAPFWPPLPVGTLCRLRC
jgi:hypothetical protein